MELLERARTQLESANFTPRQIIAAGIRVSEDGSRRSAYQLLSFPDVSFEHLCKLDASLAKVDANTRVQLSRDALYANYITRQQRDVEALMRDEAHEIPANFYYALLKGLSNELLAKLSHVRPATLAQAGRIEGMTPAALTLILARLRQSKWKRSA